MKGVMIGYLFVSGLDAAIAWAETEVSTKILYGFSAVIFGYIAWMIYRMERRR
jgi:hypothetical protein